jgi:undecaprenyl-diphosphatase
MLRRARRLVFPGLWFCVAWLTAATGETAPAANAPAADSVPARPGEGAPLGYFEATVLGLVEGVTEFLPVSSTGHLILANGVLDLEREVQALDRDGVPLWREAPDPAKGIAGTPYTVKAAADTYTVAIQVGAIAAVALIYWRTIWQVLLGLAGRNPAGLRLLRNLLVAFAPAVVLGLVLEDFIDSLFSVNTVAAALAVGAVIMVLADRWKRGRIARHGDAYPDPRPEDLTIAQALFVGVMQCAALWPGMSRSMMTIVGGYLAGLRPASASCNAPPSGPG